MSTSTKTTVNTITNGAYPAGLIGGFAIGYSKVGHMIMKNSPPAQLEKINRGAGIAILYIGLGLLTKDYLVASRIIPADIMK